MTQTVGPEGHALPENPDGADAMPPLARALLKLGDDLDAAHTKMQAEMEAMAEALRVAVLKCEPKQLIGFHWGQLLMGQMVRADEQGQEAGEPKESSRAALDDIMFALEYVHAVLSSHKDADYGKSVESDDVHAVLNLATELRKHALMYCLVAARRMPEGLLGPETGTMAMQAMTSWVTIRGHRYQALEAEFFEFVFEPHDDALRAAYGIGAKEVSAGIQAAVDATRFGHMKAAEALFAEMHAAYELAEKEGIELKEAIARLYGEGQERQVTARSAVEDLFFGGICNVTKSSGLPPDLLADLAYVPGEEKEFFAEGALRGTPLRRMPGRVKPLVTLNDGYYTCDANFLRDSTYRALQWGLQRRLSDYRQEWLNRQTALTEGAFMRIFSKQLAGAEVLTSVYYPDPDTGNWVENDVLILQNDVLLQLEVKAGVMPMHSPEVFFERHVRTIQELVLKAHQQCERFLRYAASAPEVPVYQLVGGSHVEVRRLRLGDYRVVLPIGLTVEAFTPFSSMSKRLPEVRSILGKHPFVSMSIDDLFVLTRFLPTTGELTHYLSVRQGVAGVHEAVIFDELDHLGSYVTKNRADQFYAEQLAAGATWLLEADACAPIDEYFADPDWATKPPPAQKFPATLQSFLKANDANRGPRFLDADATVRDLDANAREQMALQIDKLRPALERHPYRWFSLVGEEPLLVWLQRTGFADFAEVHKAKAEAAAVAVQAKRCKVLVVYVKQDGTFDGGWTQYVPAPAETDNRYGQRVLEAAPMTAGAVELTPGAARRLKGHGR
ncbi:hypothetical protein EJO66_22990 [Variovorax beijingensis]|uniref:Uncharacterized protein n=1 Tax=Variovorax beijingensis TaxID=2496117 RepID=A0ABY0A127_9BURK|nr:hypothetical protein [Variovorax beijingensis]RSZ31636.1 hypothetical protein EJO66_22990 [Variovorax beijingensis]